MVLHRSYGDDVKLSTFSTDISTKFGEKWKNERRIILNRYSRRPIWSINNSKEARKREALRLGRLSFTEDVIITLHPTMTTALQAVFAARKDPS